jgi:hypothetical protein
VSEPEGHVSRLVLGGPLGPAPPPFLRGASHDHGFPAIVNPIRGMALHTAPGREMRFELARGSPDNQPAADRKAAQGTLEGHLRAALETEIAEVEDRGAVGHARLHAALPDRGEEPVDGAEAVDRPLEECILFDAAGLPLLEPFEIEHRVEGDHGLLTAAAGAGFRVSGYHEPETRRRATSAWPGTTV